MMAENLNGNGAPPDDLMDDSDMEVDDATIDGHLSAAPAVSISSFEDIEDREQESVSKAAGSGDKTEAEWKKQHNNDDHNKKERQRRKILKEAVTELRKQLRKPTRKPVTIKVLEAAQEEIKDLKDIETSSLERLEALKKRHSQLQWKLDELVKEVSKLPDSDPMLDPRNVATFSSQHVAPQTPPSASLPTAAAAYFITPFSLPQQPQQQQQHSSSLVNIPVVSVPPATAALLHPRLPVPGHPFLQTPFFPHIPALPSAQPTQHTSFPGFPVASNVRTHPFLLPSNSGVAPPSSYLIPPHAPFFTHPFLRSNPSVGFLGGQRTFPPLLTPEGLYQPSAFSMPATDLANKESTFPAHSLNAPLRKTSSAGAATSQSVTAIPSGRNTTAVDRLHPNVTPPVTQGTAMLRRTTSVEDGMNTIAQHQSLHGFKTTCSSLEENSNLAGSNVAAADSDEDKSIYSNVEGTSVSASQSLPDDEEEETDFGEKYTWRRKKRRRKRRNRQGFPSSSDSESEGSCSSSQRGRIRGERLRNSSSRSSASGSEVSRRGGCGGKSKSKKCPSLTVNQLCCVPPLLKVSAVELNCPCDVVDPGSRGRTNLELISECEITVTANASYVPTTTSTSPRIPPCPSLDRLPEAENKDSGNSSMTDSPQSSSSTPSSEDASEVNWTEVIIERSMENLKRKFSDSQDFSDAREHDNNSSYPTNTSYPILLNT